MADTLKRIALDWALDRCNDQQAQARYEMLRKPRYHADDTPYGDGGWYDGDPDNTSAAVYAQVDLGHLTAEQADRFLHMITNGRKDSHE